MLSKVIHGAAAPSTAQSGAMGNLEAVDIHYLFDNCPKQVDTFRDGLPKYKDFDPLVGGSGELLPE